ncbi:hypothetical protein SAMN05216241_105116 [Limimonas halophila]|uniref:Curlin associated repeat-containing protein n=1 Tax=Limimonas halophila TaxID=1082479 RepID=A0A1G7RFR4_9PROT|nr:hypothetical protein [Limimonas halophila]SDG09608.1 hypothetical protein SAMN05216241_105116 [Limimonas halophila]
MTARIRTLALIPAAALALALAPGAQAQPGNSGQPPGQAGIEQIELPSGVTIPQQGQPFSPELGEAFDPSGPLPAVFTQLPPAAPGNAAFVVQDGSTNASVLVAAGRGNRTAQLQRGSGHVSEVTIEGNANRALTDQAGRDHEAILTIAGDGSAIATIQRGAGKRIEIDHTGPQPAGLVVRQN